MVAELFVREPDAGICAIRVPRAARTGLAVRVVVSLFVTVAVAFVAVVPVAAVTALVPAAVVPATLSVVGTTAFVLSLVAFAPVLVFCAALAS